MNERNEEKIIVKKVIKELAEMNIDEAIENFRYDAENNRIDLDLEFAKENEQIANWLTKLKEYQQLEEQGMLIKLPCKVGDVVYAYCNEFGY